MPSVGLQHIKGVVLLCVFTYIHALLIDKDLCECQNILIKFLCALLFVSFIFSMGVSPFIPIFMFPEVFFSKQL